MTLARPVAILVIGRQGLDTARAAQATVGVGARLHGWRNRVAAEDMVAFDDVGDHLRQLFENGTAIVGVCAAGILIRALAPVVGDKPTEPPVVALSDDGRQAVPLLGGHHGANDLARQLAESLGGNAAVTTASDTVLGVALDSPPDGWWIENPADVKGVTADVLAGEPAEVVVEAGDGEWLAPLAGGDGPRIVVTDRADADTASALVLRPPSLAVGVGCERDTDPAEVIDLVQRTLAGANLTSDSVAAVVSLDLKSDEPAVHAVADALGCGARFFDAATLEAITPRLANPSEAVYAAVGCHGVAEGAALAAAGDGGSLVVEKQKSARATCAVARSVGDIARSVGRGRGALTIVGTGPGAADWLTPAAGRAVAAADALVGYGPYLDLLGRAARGKARHAYELGQETDRCRAALDLAAKGQQAVLVSSGDPGIFAMATLVMQLLDESDNAAWRRVAVSVEPGVSAMQLAAARAGAPLGHDFCAISLSDLMTPWPVIAKRLYHAAQGDFVVALYNPASLRRRRHIDDAKAILLEERNEDTPVVVGRNLGRTEESLTTTTLGDWDTQEVDMLSVVLIGNSQSRVIATGSRDWVYTPRGYGGAA